MPNNIRVRREALGWDRQRLAREARISYPYVVKLEADENSPSLPIARRLAAALRTSVDRLFPATDEAGVAR